MFFEVGYCPWCGSPITVMDMFASTRDLEWNHCNTWGCKGAKIPIITNEHGYVIHPYHIRGNYIYAKPPKKTKNFV